MKMFLITIEPEQNGWRWTLIDNDPLASGGVVGTGRWYDAREGAQRYAEDRADAIADQESKTLTYEYETRGK